MEFMKLDIQFFATAFAEAENTSLKSSAGNKGKLYASLTEIAPTEDEKLKNQSRVTCYCKFTQVTGSYTQHTVPYLRLYWFDNNENKNGKEVAKVQVHTINYGNYDKVEELTATITVKHLDDGTLKGYVKAKWEYDGTGNLPCKTGYATTSNTALYEIPRANKITECPEEAYIGDTPIIEVTQNSDAFTTNVYYELGGLTGNVKEDCNGTIDDWTIPEEFYSAILETQEETCTLKVETYNGEIQIGDTQTHTFKVRLKEEECRPTASIQAQATEELNPNTYSLTGSSDRVVKGYSNVKCIYSCEARKESWLKKVSINGVVVFEYTDGEKTTELTEQEYTFENATTNIFDIEVIDSRSFEDETQPHELTLVEYFKPTIGNTFFKRNSPTDGKVNLTYEGSFFNDSFGVVSNDLKLYYSYKIKNDSDYCDWIEFEDTEIEIVDNLYQGEFMLPDNFNYKNIYNMRFTTSDALTSPGQIVYLETISKGKPVLWWDEEGIYTTEEYYKENQETGEYEKLVSESVVGNLEDLETNDTSSIVTAINSVKEKNIISASLTANYTVVKSDTYEQVPLNSSIKIGDKLTLTTDGKVKVGSGLSKVLVSAKFQLLMANLTVGGKNFVIRKNGNIVSRAMFYVASAINTSEAVAPVLIEVTEGDLIDIAYYGKANEQVANGVWTYLTVESVE